MPNERLDVVDEAARESFPASDSPAWLINGAAAGTPPPGPGLKHTVSELLLDGVIAGVIGYVVVALFFALASVVTGHSVFYIPALLGTELFFRSSGADIMLAPGPVIAYNGAHLFAFFVMGVVLAWLARIAGELPQGWYLSLLSAVFVLAHVVALPAWFDEPVRAALPLWLVAVATSLAMVAMGAYLWFTHPDIRAAMHEPDE